MEMLCIVLGKRHKVCLIVIQCSIMAFGLNYLSSMHDCVNIVNQLGILSKGTGIGNYKSSEN